VSSASIIASKWNYLVPRLVNNTPPRTADTVDDDNGVKSDETSKQQAKEEETKQEGRSQQESGRSDDEEEVTPNIVKSDTADDNNKESGGTKREKDDDENYDNHDCKRIKYWTAHKKPIAVPTEAEWYLGHKGDELFIRQSTEDCFNLMWEAVRKSKDEWAQKERDGHVAFVVTGAPGLGKSWCSNAVVWYLLQKQQSMWFHSASDKTLTTIEFSNGSAYPVVTDRPEADVLSDRPPAGTWFLYDSVGNAQSGQTQIPFTKQLPGIPCIIFSSPKDTNYRNGLKDMEGGPRGGKVWYLWLPTWAWVELETVMPSLYISFAGSRSRRNIDEFKEFVKAMYDIWGGIPRRFAHRYATFEDKGKDSAIAEAGLELQQQMKRLAPQVISMGPALQASRLDALHQSAERDSRSHNVSPPSWLLHPLPVESATETFREYSYRFCSRRAEVLFLDHLAKSGVDEIRKFCKEVFAISAAYGLAFERFAHFVLTRTEAGDYRWRKYNGSERHKLTLPKCTALPKCDMKTDLREFKEQIVTCIREQVNGFIDPLSDQQDAIDMFFVFKDGQVFALQDTISKTHSFHPVKILEYRKAAKEALESAAVHVSNDFFKHVVVVPTEEESSQFQLQWPTMPRLNSDLETVIAKFNEVGLEMPTRLDKRNKQDSRRACEEAKMKIPASITLAEARIKGAKADLLMQAKKEVECSTWVLDGFF